MNSHEFTLNVGHEEAFEVRSEANSLSVIFEDDGETGYLYALDYAAKSQLIQEAMQIYNVKNVVDKDKASTVRISWSRDGMKAGLWINNYPHAIFDFEAHRGYCRSNFPSPQNWKTTDFSWSDSAINLFL